MGKCVLIIIVFHNEKTLSDTLDTLHSVRECEYKNYDIALINNGMSDSAKKVVISQYPDVHYLNTGKNLGFAGGNNIGIDYGLAKGYELFLLLNNDVSVAPDFLSRLAARLEQDETIGLVGPKTFYQAEKDKVWAAGGYIIKWRALVGGLHEDGQRKGEYFTSLRLKMRKFLRKNKNSAKGDDQVDYLPASCILIRRQVIEKIGKLPDEYFFAYEEAEFALRAKQAGYKVVLEPNANIWHKVGLSAIWTPQLIYNSYRSRLLFLKRIYKFPLNALLTLILFSCKILQPSTHKVILIEALIDNLKYKRIEGEHLSKVKQRYE